MDTEANTGNAAGKRNKRKNKKSGGPTIVDTSKPATTEVTTAVNSPKKGKTNDGSPKKGGASSPKKTSAAAATADASSTKQVDDDADDPDHFNSKEDVENCLRHAAAFEFQMKTFKENPGAAGKFKAKIKKEMTAKSKLMRKAMGKYLETETVRTSVMQKRFEAASAECKAKIQTFREMVERFEKSMPRKEEKPNAGGKDDAKAKGGKDDAKAKVVATAGAADSDVPEPLAPNDISVDSALKSAIAELNKRRTERGNKPISKYLSYRHKEKESPWIVIGTDLELRGPKHMLGFPSSIGFHVGIFEEGQFASNVEYEINLLMPKIGSWADGTAYFFLSKVLDEVLAKETSDTKDASTAADNSAPMPMDWAGRIREALTHKLYGDNPKSAVTFRDGWSLFCEFVGGIQAIKPKNCTVVCDAFDMMHASYWMDMIADHLPLVYRIGAEDWSPPMEAMKFAGKARDQHWEKKGLAADHPNRMSKLSDKHDTDVRNAAIDCGIPPHSHRGVDDSRQMVACLHIRTFGEQDSTGKFNIEKLVKSGVTIPKK